MWLVFALQGAIVLGMYVAYVLLLPFMLLEMLYRRIRYGKQKKSPLPVVVPMEPINPQPTGIFHITADRIRKVE